MNYKPTSGTLTFGPGVTKGTFTVPLIGDKQVKGPQTVLLLLSNPASTSLGPLSTAVLSIGDVDVGGTVKLASPTFSISEAAGSAVITVNRAGGTAGGVTVDFEAADQPCGSPPCAGKAQGGFDYQAVSGTLTFGAGETTKTILIPVTNDAQVNGNRTFLVTLSNPQGGATLGTPSSSTVTIVNDDRGGVLQFSATSYTVTEPTSVTATATITVTRTGTSLGAATVAFSTANGTATAGSDYVATATTLVFGQGETSKTVGVPILPDGVAEGNETVLLTLANPGGGATLGTLVTAVLTIVDSAPSTRFSASTFSVTEGSAATITVLRGGSATGTLRVNYATGGGSALVDTDYKAVAGTLTFGPGVTSANFTVPTLNTPATDGDRTVNLALSATTVDTFVATPATATLTILDNDAAGAFQFAASSYTATEGGPAPQLTVVRTGGSAGTVLIRWTATGGTATGGPLATTPGADYAPTTGVLTFGPGVTRLKLPLAIVNDTIPEDAETVTFGLAIEGAPPAGAAIGGAASTTLTILDNDNGGSVQFAAATQTVAESVAGGKVNLVVTRTGSGLGSGVLVDYAPTGDLSAVVPPSGTLTFAAGQVSAMIPVTILNNAAAEAERVVTVTLTNPRATSGGTDPNAPALGPTASTNLTIVDDEPRLQFGAALVHGTQSGVASVTVTRTGSTAGPITVNYATGGGSAMANTHYVPASGTLTFAAGI